MTELPKPHPARPSEEAAKALARELTRRVSGEVRFGKGDLALYATDASNYRQLPIGIVIPRNARDVVEAIAVCRDHGVPVLGRAGGTSLAGQCCNAAVVIDCSKYLNRVIDIDAENKLARVEPGCVLDWLRDKAEEHHLTFGPDPSTHDRCCLGGMIGNNSCGIHSVMAGRTADNVRSLEVITYDGLRLTVGPTSPEELARIIAKGGRRGEIYAGLKRIVDTHGDAIRKGLPKIPRRVSGYNLDALLPENGFNVVKALVGSESTCAYTLSAELELVHSPPARVLLVLGYKDVYEAGDHAPLIVEHGAIGLEGLDSLLIGFMKLKDMHVENLGYLPEGGGWLLAEFGGETQDEAEEKACTLMVILQDQDTAPDMRLYTERADQRTIWEIRESGLGATAFVPGQPDAWPGWEDAGIPPDRIGQYLRDFRALMHRYDYEASLYGHFGDGCIHTRINFDLTTRKGIDTYRKFAEEAADLVVSYGGSLSGEHGDGLARSELLPRMYDEQVMQAFREFKTIWDPLNRMNPGNIVEPYAMDSHLRLGAGFKTADIASEYAYPKDEGGFGHAVQRCVGVGKCRHHSGGVMCPSYMATMEEEHSTRGRARLLWEMTYGHLKDEGWKSHKVHESLDLCLACKGCKSDCPVTVDMATYKSEFHHKFYKNRLRPPEAYSLGLIFWWSRIASPLSGLTNSVMNAPGLSTLIKAAGGIAQQRSFPPFAKHSFRQLFKDHRLENPNGPAVVLFADTFSNYFHADVAMAAVEVLEDAGYKVIIPEKPVCCGRPLYAWGMLDLARKNLRDLMDQLSPYAEQNLPIVGLEPACMSAFRDELPQLFPDDSRARSLAEKSHLLGGFLNRQGYEPPPLRRKAIVHVHCHHHATMGFAGDRAMLDRLDLDWSQLDSGCCGMAGSFGFEKEHYEISVKCAERVLMPAVRQSDPGDLILTDGFSCREQIASLSDRGALHIAQVIQMAIRERQRGLS